MMSKTLNASIVRSTSTIATVGLSSGSVIRKNARTAPHPSTRAASYTSPAMVVQDVGVVAEPLERVAARERTGDVLERDDERPARRVQHHPEHDDRRRQQQEEGQPALPGRGAVGPPPVPGRGRARLLGES